VPAILTSLDENSFMKKLAAKTKQLKILVKISPISTHQGYNPFYPKFG
jgi:hypothetical protein